MRRNRTATATLILLLGTAWVAPCRTQAAAPAELWQRMKVTAQSYLGRPYVWGTTGLKSFDCSGYVWRVLFENGIFMKRTTARKLYMCLPKVSGSRERSSGNIVFFNSLKHCGIVNDPASFYHAQVSVGTNLSPFNSFWLDRVTGYRAMPVSGK